MSTTLATIDKTLIKVRWGERYVSQGLNVAMSIASRGIHHGFDPVGGPGLTLTLVVNPVTAQSAMSVRDYAEGMSLVYRTQDTVTLDLTAHANTKVYVGAFANWTELIESSGNISAYTQAEFDAGQAGVIWFCSVDVPASGTIVAAEISTACRTDWWREGLEAGCAEPHNALPDYSAPHMLFYPHPNAPNAGGGGERTSGDDLRWSAVLDAGAKTSRVLQVEHFSGGEHRFSKTLGLVPVLAGERVVVSFRRKLEAATADFASLAVAWIDEQEDVVGGETVLLSDALAAVTEDWIDSRHSAVAPATAAYAIIYIIIEDLSSGKVFMEDFYASSERTVAGRSPAPHGAATTASGLLIRLAQLGEVAYFGRGYDSDAGLLIDTRGEVDLMIKAVGQDINLLAESANLTTTDDIVLFAPDIELVGAVNITTNDLTINTKRRTQWLGGYMLKDGVITGEEGDWTTSVNALLNSSTGNKTLGLALSDVPNGAEIDRVRVFFQYLSAAAGSEVEINFYKRVFNDAGVMSSTVLSTVTSDPSGLSPNDVKILDITNPGGGGNAIRGDFDAFFIEVKVDNDGVAGAWTVRGVVVDWFLDQQAPTLY